MQEETNDKELAEMLATLRETLASIVHDASADVPDDEPLDNRTRYTLARVLLKSIELRKAQLKKEGGSQT